MVRDLKAESTKLLSFYMEGNFSRVDLKRTTTDVLPNSGHKDDILNAHFSSFR
jgi:hypothetical protein